MKNYKRILALTLLFLAVFALTFLLVLKIKSYLFIKNIESENQNTVEEAKKTLQTPVTTAKVLKGNHILRGEPDKPISSTGYLEVPFICQAPLETVENWKLHEESCEEAALLQAYLYITGKTMTKQEANEEILKMINWQEQNFGEHYDIYADQVKEMAMKFYNLKETQLEIIENAQIDDIKKAINEGHPVVVPITGSILKNPYYPYPGYHMLVAIGYTSDKIITNDNGTRKGKDFSYDIAIFEAAMKDAGGEILILKQNQ
ncbi:MAG: C39 family peptidase [Patescibacteria group bacterium]